MLAGFTNTYSVFSIIVFSLAIGVWVILHVSSIKHTGLTLGMKKPHPENIWTNEKGDLQIDKEEKLPFPVIFMALVIMGLNVLQFLRNLALR